MYILGISAFYHDSAATLIKNGEIIAAAQEERFTRKKNDAGFPSNAIRYCLKEAEIDPSQLQNVIFYEKPFLKFERILETYLAFAPRGFKSFINSIPVWIKDKLFQKSLLINQLKSSLDETVNWKDKLLFSEHHLSHAASAFYPSPFKNAAILTLDGVGEWTTSSIAIGKNNNIRILKEMNFPNSLGLLYSAFTYYTGFKVNSGEYKLMGLAPYGEPKYAQIIKNKLIDIAQDGSFKINMSYFNYATELNMTNKKFDKLFGAPPRIPDSEITQLVMDLAASVQKVTEDIIITLAENIASETGEDNLCIAGGVALNCVANGNLLRKKIFKNIWIQPAAGDAGGALGAALVAWHLHHKRQRKSSTKIDGMKGAYLGPKFNNAEIEIELKSLGANYQKLSNNNLINKVCDLLIAGKTVGWMQGRMEFGPRALGARSILADPRSPNMQKKLNLQVKYRESFRPFAPSVLKEDAKEWFEHDLDSPYMSFVAKVKNKKRNKINQNEKKLFGLDKLYINRSIIPAITHVDFSARIQTVQKETNKRYHDLITNFKNKTGCPILINTSFNIRGEPIVCTPKDGFICFLSTELDAFVVEKFLLIKEDQENSFITKYLN